MKDLLRLTFPRANLRQLYESVGSHGKNLHEHLNGIQNFLGILMLALFRSLLNQGLVHTRVWRRK